MKENAKWMDSIEGKTTTLKNSMQTLWNDTLSSPTIKFFLDLANAIVKVADAFGLLPTAVGAFSAYKFAAKGLKDAFDSTRVSTKTLKQQLSEFLTAQNNAAKVASETATASREVAVARTEEATATTAANAATTNGVAANTANAEATTTKAQASSAAAVSKTEEATSDQIEGQMSLFNAEGNQQEAASSNTVTDAKAREATQLYITADADQIEGQMSLFNADSNQQEAAGKGTGSGVTKNLGNSVGIFSLITKGATKAATAVKALGLAFGKAALIMLALKAVTWVFGKIKDTIKEAFPTTEELIEKWNESKKKVEEISSELENVQSRINELKAQGVLSFTDKQELEQLRQTNDELERRLRLEQQSENEAGRQAKAAIEKDYEKEFIKPYIRTNRDEIAYNNARIITDAINQYALGFLSESNISDVQATALQTYAPEVYNYITSSVWGELDSTAQTAIWDVYDKYNNVLQNLDFLNNPDDYVKGSDYIDQAIQKIKEYKNELYDENGQLRDGLDDEYVVKISTNIDELETDLASAATELYQYIDDYGGDANDGFVKQLQSLIDQIDLAINPIDFYNDKFDEIFGKYSDEKRELYELAEQGKLTADVLNGTKYTPLMSELNKLGVTAQDVADHIAALSEMEISQVVHPTFSIRDYAEDIDSIQEKMSDYQSALSSLNEGNFTQSDFIDLIQKYPDLAKGVDVTSKSFKGLDRNIRKAMRSAPDDLINDLKSLRDQLVKTGESTESIDQLIDSIESMPEDAVRSMTDEYITLADAMNEAKVAQTELQAAMEENPNEGYETRGEAIEKMISLMEKGMIGSESELWSIAEAYGFTYDSAKSINENADALANFIAIRQRWYKTDDDGNYTFEGTENFVEDVESVINSNSYAATKLKSLGVEWSYIDGALDIDFNNADWDEIVSVLSTTEEFAGLTSEEFADMMMQIGQFFGIDWQDANDLATYLNNINDGTESLSENFDLAKNAVASFLKSEGYSTDLLELNVDDEEFKALPEDIQKVLEEYYELKQKFESDPLSISWQLDKDSETNLEKGLTEESLSSLSQLGTIAHDVDTGVSWASIEDLIKKADEAGMDVKNLRVQLDELVAAGKLINLNITETDPLGLQSMQSDAETTITYLEAMGIKIREWSGAFTIDLPSFIDLMAAAGWSSERISAYISELNGNGYTFTYTTEENKVETLDVNTQEGQAKVDELVTTSDTLTDTEILTVNINGTAEGALKAMKANLASMTSTDHKISIYQTTYKNTVDNGADSLNGTAHASGTAHARGSWGAPRTETALVGELGPELLVRGSRWTTIGDNGAEFTQIKKGDIIFNHKQTEDLLSKGYITGRGKAYASGTAYLESSGVHTTYNFDGNGNWTSSTSNALNNTADNLSNAANNLSSAASDVSDSADEFREVFDWIEVRISEINEKLDLKAAQLENAVGRSAQNAIVNDMIDINETLYNNLAAGLNEYSNYASTLLAKIPAEYQEAAQNGAIAIEEFVGEANEETLEAIQNYRDWSDKVAELQVQMEELVSTIAELAKQRFDNISEEFENIISLFEGVEDRINAMISLVEESGYVASNLFYEEMTTSAQEQIAQLTQQLTELQNSLAQAIANNEIQIGSEEWYEMVQEIQDVGTAIIEAQTAVEEYQNAMNDIYWDNFDNLINQFEYLSEETQNMIDLLSHEDLVDEFGNWTDEGIASMGLYAQQMEIAEYQANQYAQAIADLNRDYAAGRYSESEYLEKLNELQSAQYDSIEAYHEAQEAIVDLNEARVDAIKEGIEKEIDAYQELISKKKEELDAEKDLYDFQKSVMEQQKDITDIERKLAALSNDQSASAMAKRRQLEAELAEAKAELEETYYDRSVDQQQEAYDKEAEVFEAEKNAEIEKWEEYLENVEQVVADSLLTVQENATGVYNTLSATASEYGVTLSDAILTPWESGINAISNYQEVFDTASSETLSQLERIYSAWLDNIELANTFAEVSMYGSNASPYGTTESINNATNPQTQTTTTTTTTTNNNTDSAPASTAIAVGGKINAGSASIYANSNGGGGSRQYFASDPIYTVLEEKNGYLKVRWHKLSSGVTGWFKKSDVKALATGTTNLKKSGIVNIDELGEELVLRAKNGRLTYMEKGSGVIPADLTSNLMSWGELNPQDMLDRNRPSIGVSPEINHTEISIDQSIGELIHIDNCSTETLPDVKKIVNEALEKHTQRLNQSLRKYTR